VEQDFELTIALLSRAPATLNALLRDLPNAWTLSDEGKDTMTPREVVAHLIDADLTNWIPRAQVILQHGEQHPLPSFDRFGKIRASRDRSLSQLLDEFAKVRSQKLDELREFNLRPEDLVKSGRHPALGVITLSQLLAAWTTHDLTHLHQISRILAHQYGQAVGPFHRFLGVLQCAGHSASA
jgi:hypothetical protein